MLEREGDDLLPAREVARGARQQVRAGLGEALLHLSDARAELLDGIGVGDPGEGRVNPLEQRGSEGSNVVGFARFRLGAAAPTALVEIVRQPHTAETAVAAAKEIFEAAGLQVAICGDFDGRILDRLVRPYFNAALRRLDEGLATADDLDTTLRLGLGYPEGPLSLLERTGLEHHHDVTQALFEALGDPAYAPARRARVAKIRRETK